MDSVSVKGRLHVVVGILTNSAGQVFIQQRRAGTPKAGMWEFPGGKLERGEQPVDALRRELSEELGITVTEQHPLTVVTHDYDHALVYLDTFIVTAYRGDVSGREGQLIAWTSIEQISEFNILPAVPPIVEAILKYRTESNPNPAS